MGCPATICATFDCGAATGGGSSDCAVLTIDVACAPETTGTVGEAFSSSVSASNGSSPYTFEINAGTLPPGLSLNPSSGAITGTPTTEGVYPFTVLVTDDDGTPALIDCAITVSAASVNRPAIDQPS